MVSFWDTSALVPLIVEEQTSVRMRALRGRTRQLCAWLMTPVEVHSAMHRLRRTGELSPAEVIRCLENFDKIFSEAFIIDNARTVARRAQLLLARHPLKGADALQLAAASCLILEDPAGVTFVTLDGRLAAAARAEGMGVADGK